MGRMKILFSEDEWFYRDLGLVDVEGVDFVFGGMKYYKSKSAALLPFDLFVCTYYTMPHNVILTHRFRNLGIKSLLCTDGIIDLANSLYNPMHVKYGLAQFHPIIQDYFLCVGKSEAAYFSYDTVAFDFIPKRMVSMKKIIPPSNHTKILITTANTSYYNDDEFDRLHRMLTSLIIYFERHGISFGIRIFDQRLLQSLVGVCEIERLNDVKNDFETTLSSYSAVITTPSSIAVASMYHERPTAILVYRDTPMFLQGGWIITDTNTFTSCIGDFSVQNKRRMDIQSRLLRNYSFDIGVTERICAILKYPPSSKKIASTYYVNRSLLNMLNSSFNINFEWYVRKIYRFLLKVRLLKQLILKVKKNIF